VTDVLVVGAGPTGLTLAAQLQAHGVQVRIVERRRAPRPSRAFIVHPRTLEQLALLGLADEVVARGDPTARVQLHAGAREVGVTLRQPAMQATAYPFLLPVPQADVEEVLARHVRRSGVAIEHGTRATGVHQEPDGVEVRLEGPHGSERIRVPYLVGCDGADSTVRRETGTAFPGRRYRSSLLLADVEVASGLDPGAIHAYVGPPGILVLLPAVAATGWRLLAVDPFGPAPRAARAGRPPGLGRLQAAADRFAPGALRLAGCSWAEEVTLRRGQAVRYRTGRVLLAGDAAHVHSPAGGQGMNTGIQDACNLGWKLALVATGTVGEPLLDTYQAERWRVARRTRQATDLAFLVEAGDAPLLRLLRRHLTPSLLPLVDGRTLPGPAFRRLGGLAVHYRTSPLVSQQQRLGRRRGLRPGERLPDGRIDVEGRPGRLHDVLRSPAFHLLLCGCPEMVRREPLGRLPGWAVTRLQIHELSRHGDRDVADPDGRLLTRLGIGRVGSILVRPDGYVAWRADGPELEGLVDHLRTYG
jgi:2-polyprenyl-6-methoxyphenol hydroxylase-like FAD-dependent oxidoreductase